MIILDYLVGLNVITRVLLTRGMLEDGIRGADVMLEAERGREG